MENPMPTYNVHLYREMRLFFTGIEADTPEQAARLVADKATDEADYTDDCEGATTSALVDLVGDEDYSESVAIDLDPMRSAAQELYEALKDSLPALWLTATSGHPDAIRIHNKARDAIALAHRKSTPNKATSAPSLEATLLTIKEWLETGKVDGITRSNASIIEEIDAVLAYGKTA
jgi:hypothetical protein